MLVVGASLARAFGIVGAANLVRYRSKIDDPKDAGVMLCALAVGLASGVGLYALAVFSTVFMVAALWVIESFEPERKKLFELKIKMGEDTDARRKDSTRSCSRFQADFELRQLLRRGGLLRGPGAARSARPTTSPTRILKLDPEGHGAVEWEEKKARSKPQ